MHAARDMQEKIGAEENISMDKSELAGVVLPAEWHFHDFAQLTWPHEDTDWAYMLDEVYTCFVEIAREIAKREPLLVVTPYPARVKKQLDEAGVAMDRVSFFETQTNDTWARDHAFITVKRTTLDGNVECKHLDFCFNGWGMKYAANQDNRINRRLFDSGMMKGEYVDCLDFVLEGGSIESDGCGTLMTTTACLLAPNRNARHLSKKLLEQELCARLGASRVLWIDHGYLAGDDTDCHVDTLARFCPGGVIAYVQCVDQSDEHYDELHLMEEQLKGLVTMSGEPYRLAALPMPDAIYDEAGERLPATYANFLIMNDAVLVPTYSQPLKDAEAIRILQQVFTDREVVGIDCRALIRQHGSLHCVTMQYPA